MSLCRQLPWSVALRSLRADRAAPVRGALAARALAEAHARETLKAAPAAPLCVAGVFDRAAIMRLAVASARLERARGSSLSWSALVGSALRLAWARAKAARRATTA